MIQLLIVEDDCELSPHFFAVLKKAVVVLYLIDLVFVLIGVGLAAAVAFGFARYLLVYGVAIVFFGLVGATATKAALRHRWMMQASEEGGGTSSEDSTVETVEKPDADPIAGGGSAL